MSWNQCEIKHAKHSEAYELYIDGKFSGSFDTVTEAAKEYEEIRMEHKEEID